ncbi:MAG: aldehyde dehydrogenase (NADP(+)) [Acidobacteriia bacterium]|nr:aldehyde dehydrogenase (NADP(+)) [Terriglobia bacterium]
MALDGTSLIGFSRGSGREAPFRGVNATTGRVLEPPYYSCDADDVDRAVNLAVSAFGAYRALPRQRRAEFLRQIATRIEELGDPLLERAMEESALLPARVRGERDRTCLQLRFFAGMVEEGSWVDARVDTADPERRPLPKPDVRSMLRPLGPVAVFCAANFPLAFSVAGGDTASALASGNPVVVNAHFAHPGTAELVGTAVRDAAQATGMPEGVFSLLFGSGHQTGQALVTHPGIRAVAFTGSRRGGMALHQLAQSRPEPIPFYAEMGSINAVFLLPGALQQAGGPMAAGLYASINLAVGQYCTNPGVLVVPRGPAGDEFSAALAGKMRDAPPAPMLHAGILENYRRLVAARSKDARVRAVAYAETQDRAVPALFEVDAGVFMSTPELSDEVFGPSSLMVRCGGPEDALALAEALEGNLTASIWAGPGDEAAAAELVAVLEAKVGRIVFQGVPTTLEICQAMVHGGPFPATSDGRSTSVGGRAIERFTRPVCFQDAPDGLLPEELRNGNPAGIWRMVNGERTRG